MSTLVTPAIVRAKVCDDIQLRVAATRGERQAVFELIYRSYLRAGLCVKSDCGMRATPYQLLSTTDILLAELRGQVISTVSLVRDGDLGLPMESLYPEEVATRRSAGVNVAEISCLADRRQGTARFFGLFCDLSRLMFQLARQTGIDEILVAVNPRHAPLYRRYMAFEQIGEQRDDDTIADFPAVPLSLNFARAKVERTKSWREFFAKPLPDETLQSYPISANDRDYFYSVLDSVGRDEAPSSAASYGNSESQEADDRLLCA